MQRKTQQRFPPLSLQHKLGGAVSDVADQVRLLGGVLHRARRQVDFIPKVENGSWPDGINGNLKPLPLGHKHQVMLIVLQTKQLKR